MSERVLISIGSNLGEKKENCLRAVELLALEFAVIKRSSLYSSPPWGNTDQPAFVNSAVEVETTLTPLELLKYLKSIEERMGRRASGRWEARIIDLDIILFGDCVENSEELKVPHPLMYKRAFVLLPLSEIAPEMIDPITQKSVRELLALLHSSDVGSIKKIRR